nr:hypothetical protein [Marinobacter sp. LA51]
MVPADIGKVIRGRIENLPLLAAFLFRLIHGHVRMDNKLLLDSAMLGNQGRAHADTVFYPAPIIIQEKLSVKL